MRVVIALGGNALLKRGEPMSAETQRANVKLAAGAIAKVVSAGHEVIITHGNGPQIGFLAMQTDAQGKPQNMPLDVLNAETGGMIGYLIEQELVNTLPSGTKIVTVLTQIEVDPRDKAFGEFTKPIGPVFDAVGAESLKLSKGWNFVPDGKGFRRVVPSPMPKRLIELEAIQILLRHEVVVICAGGGGVPVARGADGKLHGVEVVIDKDRASSLLADQLPAEALLMLTDVEGVYENWGTSRQKLLNCLSCEQLDPQAFETGSMRPKIEAAMSFVRCGGKIAGIGQLAKALEILEGRAGTIFKV